MAYSKIDICNLALASLGADSIRTFDENNKRSRMASNFYDATRDYLLAKFDWPFARSIKLLTELDPDSINYYIPPNHRVYQLPSDCITPRDLHPPGSRQKWYEVELKLFTPVTGDIILYYTSRQVDSLTFSHTFITLLQLAIAIRMAPAITQDKALTKALFEQYMTEQRDCWESDANIGEDYRMYDEEPNNDTFVYPDGYVNAEDESRFLRIE